MERSLEKPFVKFPPTLAARYTDNGYKLVGHHSGVQICRWTRSALKGRRHCYKRWYGIQSHRCMQMTPALQFCNLRCVFCWRFHEASRFKTEGVWDDPASILDHAEKAQRQLLSGFKPHPDVRRRAFEEAMTPAHVAISLDGEPTLYPRIDDLVLEIERRAMTSFLVTNGTMPSQVERLLSRNAEPTNLYVSVCAATAEDYFRITNANSQETWQRLQQTLHLLKRFQRSRTVIRLTLVKRLNMTDPDQYARLIRIAEPDFVELKGYSWLGGSRERLPISAMPTHEEVIDFGDALSQNVAYASVLDDEVSRVILLSADGSKPVPA